MGLDALLVLAKSEEIVDETFSMSTKPAGRVQKMQKV